MLTFFMILLGLGILSLLGNKYFKKAERIEKEAFEHLWETLKKNDGELRTWSLNGIIELKMNERVSEINNNQFVHLYLQGKYVMLLFPLNKNFHSLRSVDKAYRDAVRRLIIRGYKQQMKIEKKKSDMLS